MDWRETRLTIRIWYRDLSARRPKLVGALLISAFILLVFLLAYLDVAVGNSGGSVVENVVRALAAMALIFFGFVVGAYLFGAVADFLAALHNFRFGWRRIRFLVVALTETIIRCAQNPMALVALAVVGTAVIWGGAWFLTDAVSFWGIFLTFVLLAASLRALRELAHGKKVGRVNSGPSC